MTSNLKQLLPEEKIEVSYQLTPSNDINRKGFPYGSLKLNTSSNLQKFISPEHEAHETLLKLFAITKDAASKNPTASNEINDKYFPSQKESFFIYPVMDERHFENGPIKQAKEILGFGSSDSVGYKDFETVLNSKYESAKKKITERVEHDKKVNDNLIFNYKETIEKKTEEKVTLENELKVKNEEKDQILKDINTLNDTADKLRIIIRTKMEGTNELTTDKLKEKTTAFDETMKQIQVLKTTKNALMVKIHEIEIEIMILSRDIRYLTKQKEKLEKENENLDNQIKYLNKSKTIIGKFNEEKMKLMANTAEKQKKIGGYQPRRSRRQSKMRGGSRKKAKRSKKNKSRHTTI
jgi:chromosome segregation ATPase